MGKEEKMKKSIIMMVTVLMLVGSGHINVATQYTITDHEKLFLKRHGK